jgi:hypothetical protein
MFSCTLLQIWRCVPADRLSIHSSLVRRLIDTQFPQRSDLSINLMLVEGFRLK